MTQDNNTDRARSEVIDEASRFVAQWRSRHPDRAAALVSQGRLDSTGTAMPEPAPTVVEGEDLSAALRAYRDESLVVIAWRDLGGLDDLEATLAALSCLADRCIEAGLRAAEQAVAARYKPPRDDGGEPARLAVIGMGKLGGCELNFSSDVDLVFAYDESATLPADADIDVAGYFRKVAQRLVRMLSENTAEGFVYRVDTRLRPFGDAGALVASLPAMESYYQNHGREWERYAWVKARPVAGDKAAGNALIRMLRPFVYRRYLDYGTFESIRDMKRLIDTQVRRTDAANDIKRGIGGIREIEFVAQAFQLIRGGQEPDLQDARLRPTLARLADAGHLAAETASQLDADYVYLRRLENRLQMVADQQTHELPSDSADRDVIARAMGFADLAAFDTETETVRHRVHEAFDRIFIESTAPTPAADEALDALWAGQLERGAAETLLTGYGVDAPGVVLDALDGLHDQRLYRMLGDRGRRWIARLVPLIIAAAGRTNEATGAITRTLRVVSEIVGRSNYIALLVEHPAALATLMRLCAASSWITSRIAEQPALLDTLLDARQLYRPASRAELAATLDADRAAIDETDLEGQMNALRRFQQSATLRIAAADVTDAMPLMIVSDRLTEVAEVVLGAALSMAWQQMTMRFGVPVDAAGRESAFAIVAYGKLGGLELGYASDLDLVFVYDGPNEGQTVDGPRSLTNQVFFTRLAQRLIHILSTQTIAGRAYEIDMRLRPSGNAGLMVTHVEAFATYQFEKAWTWEHQALVRARYVAGAPGLGARFDEIRRTVLARERDLGALAGDVAAMRDRMRRVKDESSAQAFDIKQMPGGLIDIEFMAQYAALAYSHRHAEISRFTDAIRILESVESAGLADRADIKVLTDAYRHDRRFAHAAALREERAMMSREAQAADRDRIAALWQAWIGDIAATPSEAGTETPGG
ncbi:bifunctional [glutamate--ammonia ligase]-adenylyl-L-tyrosine phosphorylase/[glutamate--ammonia-ligase] adenylyltransferase [Salinisphaera sp. Q1T1-3]|uniref:bifunctional [glutamate--ammonia ligase]-adenylyl-L-tyrosine phosphorylase/[glutamate--ammonia-ligase] adenylyltransferase n=1 Tax=Salinisphaera sp. Q1T1-3 TaxID=2321229 RepID=UPI000E765881|nr:bifunctional [glutamate--ammonia ligase]-adenylyl-L-tyrosine phosphorylase/[glutamate--ammonia-ligase] adenylyltransferase [Salinisphaera sp. Q1T1-3]RJS94694.1 bifunctional [glutamate--ammonia ligase]-adenylyl-L-tyrosine phosphorylase/[glutamate--ammonia-ligase] adenylyltransferase [Salinisphaera sp. Q1T1-3]